MTDAEMLALCAKAMGWRCFREKRGEYSLCVTMAPGEREPWLGARNPQPDRYTTVSLREAVSIGFYGRGLPNPLRDDEQAMALVKHFGLVCDPQHDGQDFASDPGWEVSHPSLPEGYLAINPSLNRAIVECVASMAAASTRNDRT